MDRRSMRVDIAGEARTPNRAAGRAGWGPQGRGVIVTGAAQGIDEATARAFADVGAHVCAVDLNEERVVSVVESLPGGPHQAVSLDLNGIDGHASVVEDAAGHSGGLRAIVLAAGEMKREPFDEVTEEAWDWQLDTNLMSTFFLVRTAGEQMRAAAVQGSICSFRTPDCYRRTGMNGPRSSTIGFETARATEGMSAHG